ncbi:MAG: DUF4834 family protein [Bacteroidaceae bacterium]|nr:DUF4834 family protein [Bacteroidaceae bacterium]
MSVFVFAIFVVLFIIVGILSIGIYLLSLLLGGFANLKNLFYNLTGWGDSSGTQQRTAKSSASDNSSSRQKDTTKSGNTGGKVFDDSEGTYVDFEEVKG